MRHVVQLMQNACANRLADDLVAPELPVLETDGSSVDDSGQPHQCPCVSGGGGGDGIVIVSSSTGPATSVGNEASDDGSIENSAEALLTFNLVSSTSSNKSKVKNAKRKRKKAVDAAAAAAAAFTAADGSIGESVSSETTAPSGADGSTAPSDDSVLGTEDAETTREPNLRVGRSSAGTVREEGAGSYSKVVSGRAGVDGKRGESSKTVSATARPPSARAAISIPAAAADSDGEDGWVVSTTRRRIKDAKEEVKEVVPRRGGNKSSKGKDGGGHPKATAGHRESLRDSHRESYRDRGDAPSRPVNSKGSGRNEGRHDRDRDDSNPPWSKGTARQDSKGDDGGPWSKGNAAKDRRGDENTGNWSKPSRERRDGGGAGSGSAVWPRAGSWEDKEEEGSCLKHKREEDSGGQWGKKSAGETFSARENGYPAGGRSKERTRSSSFADMVRGASTSNASEATVPPMPKAKPAKPTKATAAPPTDTAPAPVWGSGKMSGAPSFATVLLGGSGGGGASGKVAPPPPLKAIDGKVTSATSPATTMTASPVTAPEGGSWADAPAVAVPPKAAPALATPKPMAWTTGNTASVLRAALGGASEPTSRAADTSTDETQIDQASGSGSGAAAKGSSGPAKGLTSGRDPDGSEVDAVVARGSSPTSGSDTSKSPGIAGQTGEVREVIGKVLDMVHDDITRREHSRASKARSYARAIAESEGRAQALATAYQRQTPEVILRGSWDEEPAGKVSEAASKTDIESAESAAVVAETVEKLEAAVEERAAVAVVIEPKVEDVPNSVTEDVPAVVPSSPAAGATPPPPMTDTPTVVASAVDAPELPPPPSMTAPVHELTRRNYGSKENNEKAPAVSQSGAAGPGEPAMTGRAVPLRDVGKSWSERQLSERGSNATSWSRGNTPPGAAGVGLRQAGGRRGGGGDSSRQWPRSGQTQSGSHHAASSGNDLRSGRSRAPRPILSASVSHGSLGVGELEKARGEGRAAPSLPRVPVALRTSIPYGRDSGWAVDSSADARAIIGAGEVMVMPAAQVMRSPPRGHRPRSSSAGSSSRHSAMTGVGIGSAGHQYAHPPQMDEWPGSNDWALAGTGDAHRGMRSGGAIGGGGGGGGGWQGVRDANDTSVRHHLYPYRDDNFYRISPGPHGGAGGMRHGRQDQVQQQRRGHVESHRNLPPQPQPTAATTEHQQHQQPTAARFRSRSSGSELTMRDRRAERMEYEYNLMVSCLDRNVEGFMQKLGRAMRPRRRAWSQVGDGQGGDRWRMCQRGWWKFC